jgi:hypothetical protein
MFNEISCLNCLDKPFEIYFSKAKCYDSLEIEQALAVMSFTQIKL